VLTVKTANLIMVTSPVYDTIAASQLNEDLSLTWQANQSVEVGPQ
jgi:hypothetical protein